jgi:hypothetical protein
MIQMKRRPLPYANWRWPAILALLLAASVQAQTPPAATPKDDRAPSAAPTRSATKPTQRIELPTAEKQALEAAANPPAKAPSASDELVPTEADAKAPPPPEETTRIEQIRTRSGVSEIRITPALTGRTYTMTNREGQQPISATETLSGLSVPKFFTIEFGKPSERPAPPLPPPPSSQSR